MFNHSGNWIEVYFSIRADMKVKNNFEEISNLLQHHMEMFL